MFLLQIIQFFFLIFLTLFALRRLILSLLDLAESVEDLHLLVFNHQIIDLSRERLVFPLLFLQGIRQFYFLLFVSIYHVAYNLVELSLNVGLDFFFEGFETFNWSTVFRALTQVKTIQRLELHRSPLLFVMEAFTQSLLQELHIQVVFLLVDQSLLENSDVQISLLCCDFELLLFFLHFKDFLFQKNCLRLHFPQLFLQLRFLSFLMAFSVRLVGLLQLLFDRLHLVGQALDFVLFNFVLLPPIFCAQQLLLSLLPLFLNFLPQAPDLVLMLS